MIPLLLNTDRSLIGWLADTVQCTVSETKNSTYELQLEYACTGKYANDITQHRYIKVKANQTTANLQLFKIYKIERSLTGNVIASAEHISYGFNCYAFNYWGGFNFNSASELLANAKLHSDVNYGEYTFTGGIKTTGCKFDYFDDVVFNGADLLNWYSEKYKFLIERDNYNFNFSSDISISNSDVATRVVYGVNLNDYQCVVDTSNTYDSILPYYVWKRDGSRQQIIHMTGITENYMYSLNANDIYPLYANSPRQKTLKVKLSEMVDEEYIKDTLLSSGSYNCLATVEDYVNIHGDELSNPTITSTVDFINLADTKYYQNVVPLQQVGMHSVVNVSIQHLNVSTNVRVVNYDFDVLNERYNTITLGDVQVGITDIMARRLNK